MSIPAVPRWKSLLNSARFLRNPLEVISENYMVPGGKPLAMLDQIRRDFPMVMHGVSLSIGSTAPLDTDYLRQLKLLIDRVEPAHEGVIAGEHGRNRGFA